MEYNMPFHWCYQETEALLMFLASLPLIGLFFRRIHTRWHAKWKTLCGHKNCEAIHSRLEIKPDFKVVDEVWDTISADDVEARFGGTIMDDLVGDLTLLNVTERPTEDKFQWFINDENNTLMAWFGEDVFFCNVLSEDREWIILLQ